MFNFNDEMFSHMPFAACDYDGNIKQFCCLMVNGLWKLHYFNGIEWERVKTYLPEDTTECSPSAEFVDGAWRISFIAGGSIQDRMFKLYSLSGLDGKTKPVVQCSADVGFVWKDQVVYAGRRGPIIIIEQDSRTLVDIHNLEFLYRLSYDPYNPRCLLISGQSKDDKIFSWMYNYNMGKLHNITADGQAAYKLAFWKNECYYAERNNDDGFEERHIRKAKVLKKIELDCSRHVRLIDANQCIHGEYTNELFNTHGCKTCGKPKIVICSHENVIGRKRNSKLCNPQSCKFFEKLKISS